MWHSSPQPFVFVSELVYLNGLNYFSLWSGPPQWPLLRGISWRYCRRGWLQRGPKILNICRTESYRTKNWLSQCIISGQSQGLLNWNNLLGQMSWDVQPCRNVRSWFSPTDWKQPLPPVTRWFLWCSQFITCLWAPTTLYWYSLFKLKETNVSLNVCNSL